MSTTHEVEQAMALLDDPAFAALAEESVRDYIDWDDLTRRPLPAGLSAEDVWRLLKSIRRFGATRFPLRDMDGRRYWYNLTREAILCIDAIERYCRTDSAVHRAVLHRHGQRFLVGSRIREAVAVCELEGVEVSQRRAQELVMNGRAPQNAAERLVLNTHQVLYELEDFGDEPFSPDLIRGIYGRLVEGVDLVELGREPERATLFGRAEDAAVSPERLLEVLEEYCAYANDKAGDPSEPVAMKAHALMNTLGFWRALPHFNGIVGRCVFRLFVTRKDYPVLAYLPISSWYRAWTEHRVQSGLVRFRTIDWSRTNDEHEVDYTADAITYLQLTVAALDEFLSSIDATRRRDAEIRSVLEHDDDLNYRQRSVVSRALADADHEFRIREHQTTHNVVYATARADLLELEERGYLTRKTAGKAFVFLPTPNLAARLEGERSG